MYLCVHYVMMMLSYICVDSDVEDIPSDYYRSSMINRRQSVFGESYDPADEDEAMERVMCHYSACLQFLARFCNLLLIIKGVGVIELH